ncbi:MAG TPA: DNA modification methylase, partial [Cyanobacteria bacterium UBA11049]|nr:DNA modification methylase [Cyanobacteria bacterium UBA11049]
MFEQLSLLESSIDNDVRFHRNIQESGFDYQEVDIGDITFKAGQLESVHRWYRLTPSYSPSLVRFLIKEFQITQGHFVADPFSGRGTTSIECQKLGIKAVGIEINPLLQQVSNKSLKWDTGSLHLVKKYFTEASNLIKEYKNLSIQEVVNLFNTRIPIIHNVFRWWKDYALKDLIIFREIMLKPEYSAVHEYLWIALNKACLDCANIHRNHPTISFDDDHQREIDVCYQVGNNLEMICNDLENLSKEEICFSGLNSI